MFAKLKSLSNIDTLKPKSDSDSARKIILSLINEPLLFDNLEMLHLSPNIHIDTDIMVLDDGIVIGGHIRQYSEDDLGIYQLSDNNPGYTDFISNPYRSINDLGNLNLTNQ